ncbi:hypothetical protein Bca4012_083163 [Brassica carinata]
MIGVYGRPYGSSSILSFDGSESRQSHQSLVEWLNETLPYLNLPWEASEEELRACLMDGTVFCNLLNQLSPGSMKMGGSFELASINIERFLTAMDEMALPRFEVSDLEQGDMIPVLQSLKALKASFSDAAYDKNTLGSMRRWSLPEDQSKGLDSNFNDGLQSKEVSEINTSHAKILDLLKSNTLQNTSTRSLFDMLDKLLDESVHKMNVDVSHDFSSILRGIVQVVEQRISNQAENLKNQNILFRVREEKYRSRINVLETLASGTTDEKELRSEEQDVLQLKRKKERSDAELSKLKQEVEVLKETHEKQFLELELYAQQAKTVLEKQLEESELRVVDSTNKVKELEKFFETKTKIWEEKEQTYKSFIHSQSGALQELKATSMSLKHEVLKTGENYFQDLNYYGLKLKGVVHAAKNYQVVVEENRRLYNEVQELKGSGKTYTMSGPSINSEEHWGVNYRALNDLFHLTQSSQNTVMYEVGVQMVEIYNEQVRDLLSDDGPIPDASMHCVRSTDDVLELMNIGLMNRAVGATALNEKSSRSHSVLSVHVRGVDVKTDSELRGSLHLVDLAGSERIDRSEVTGDRLKEAQHINKSLSALGDVIFALAHKNPHVPYRNSKLTQVLQNSLGGQAKTLMFVQINPDEDSYAETISTLKFAERVSGVELGAARNYKEGRDVRKLMQEVSNLKDLIAKKDEELQKFQNINGTKRSGLNNLRFESNSPRRHSLGGASPNSSRQKQGSRLLGRTTSDSADEDIHQNESRLSPKLSETDGSNLFSETSSPLEMSEQSEQNEKANVEPSKVLKRTLKAEQTRPSRLSISTSSSSKALPELLSVSNELTLKLAREIRTCAAFVDGVDAKIWQVPETLQEDVLSKMSALPKSDAHLITPDDLAEADGFVFGFPTRFGMISAQFKTVSYATGGL